MDSKKRCISWRIVDEIEKLKPIIKYIIYPDFWDVEKDNDEKIVN